MAKYSERTRVDIARAEYDDYSVDDATNHKAFTYGEQNVKLGNLEKVVDDKETDLKMYLVKTDEHHYTVLYRGSVAPMKDGSKADWVNNDIPMGTYILTRTKSQTPQLEQAADELNKAMSEHPDATFDVYGHSLGSMCAQYSAVKVKDPQRISGVYAYEGPNVYPTLSSEERKKAAELRGKIHNYIDPRRDCIRIYFTAWLDWTYSSCAVHCTYESI